jgi:hypothetical protein
MLGDKLRRYADKIAQRPMASGERGQAAGSLDQLNQKLNDAHMPETQKHVQAAAQALREGRQQDAVSELRKAAEAADRETLVTQRETTGQSASIQAESFRSRQTIGLGEIRPVRCWKSGAGAAESRFPRAAAGTAGKRPSGE